MIATSPQNLGRALAAVAVLLLAPAGGARASSAGDPAPSTEAPLPPAVEAAVRSKEVQAAEIRREAIGLLRALLADSPPSDETAEALFKLAELIWEEQQAEYLARMGAHQQAIASCKREKTSCAEARRRAPRLDLAPAQETYARLIREYPRFRKIDTVLYLYAFSLREEGKLAEAIPHLMRLLREFPRSRFRADAWMALGEHRFYDRQDFGGALRAYDQVAKFPSSPLHGLALFKSAWCYWKLGQHQRAAARFKDVLDLGEKAKRLGTEEQKRAAELQDQALDYLVELFTGEDTRSAQDSHAFLSQIGGKAYSFKVMRRLADTVFDQTRYERAADAYLFLLAADANHPDAPEFQRRVIEAFQELGQHDRAAAEMRRLALNYGPKSAWAKANADRPSAVARARAAAGEFIRKHAKTLHAQAQRNEKESRVVDTDRFARAAEAYGFFLQQYPDAPDGHELRYLRADILFFKLEQRREAGLEYLAVGKSRPVGPQHREALLQAMNAFEALRPPSPASAAERKQRKVTDDDRRFAEAADLYATLFPNDREIMTVIYKNGQFFYDYGDHDEAIKRFGLILERYPDSPVAGPAGERLLECLGAAKDYQNIESWARRLKGTKAFASRQDQQRLDDVIAGAMMKAGEALAAKEQPEKAAAYFERVASEFPAHPAAPKALNNAGAALEKAGRLKPAVAAYRRLADRHPRAPEAPEALFVAARIQESIANYAEAAALFEQLAAKHPQAPQAADALFRAGALRQALGQLDRAVAHLAAYEKQQRGRPESRDVQFQRAVLLAERKDWRPAAAAFAEFAQQQPKDARAVEACVREAEAHMALQADARAKEALDRGLALHRRAGKQEAAVTFAAHARYLQGELLYREFAQVKIAGRPRALARSLEEKAQLLDRAKAVYLDVLSFKVAEWATAALLRVGQAYQGFAKALRQVKVPRELTPEEQQVYREELEKHVIVIEEKALEAFRSGHAKAMEIGVYDKHTRALRLALSELDQTEFPPDVEARPSLRASEAHAALEPIEEIRRD